MENFKTTWGPMLYFFIMSLIIAYAMSSCSTDASRHRSRIEMLQTEGLDRLMVEECGMFELHPNKGVAIDTTIKLNRHNKHLRVYKLNANSTRYVLCK